MPINKNMVVKKNIIILFCIFSLSVLFSCTAQSTTNSTLKPANVALKLEYKSTIVLTDSHWQLLQKKLAADNIAGAAVDEILFNFPAYENKAMATKVKELYRIKFVQKPAVVAVPSGEKKEKPPRIRIYPNIITPENMAKAKDYLNKNSEHLKNSEKTWGVPPEVAVGLLLLETKLGTYLGTEKALWSLACMAASENLDDVDDTLKGLGVKEEQKPWLASKVAEKSSWAYSEFKALLTYCTENSIDSMALPGSVYGAIGYCQFMPSNIKRYGVDADGDGKIDLFTEADAIASLSNFLYSHGWRKDSTREVQHKTLMYYNRSKVYANTILAVADHLNPPAEAVKTVATSNKVKKKAVKPKNKELSSNKKVKSKKSA